MPKMLVEGYRPGKGEGGRWFGVIVGRAVPKKAADSQTLPDPRHGRSTDLKLPRGGSAIQSSSGKK